MPPELNYLKALTERIEVFVDAEISEEAASEIKAGKNRSLDSMCPATETLHQTKCIEDSNHDSSFAEYNRFKALT